MDLCSHKNAKLLVRQHFDSKQEPFTIQIPTLNFQFLMQGKKSICNLVVEDSILSVNLKQMKLC